MYNCANSLVAKTKIIKVHLVQVTRLKDMTIKNTSKQIGYCSAMELLERS